MAKDPAFLFYPNDWLGGTMGMTFEQKGAYMELLMLQFNRGHMTEDMIGQTVGRIWDELKDKFTKDDNECWYNERLEDEKNKRKSYVASRLNNKLGKNQHTKKVGHTTLHMVNENVNINNTVSNTNKNTFNTKPTPSDFKELPQHYIDSSKELIFRLNDKLRIDNETILALWDAFKIQHLTGDNWYANEGKVYSHFINIIKKEKFSNNGTGIKQIDGTTKFNAGALELLRKGKEQFAAIAGKQGNRT